MEDFAQLRRGVGGAYDIIASQTAGQNLEANLETNIDTLRLVKPLILSAILLAAATAHAQSSADVIYIHGNILTGTHLRPNDPSKIPAQVTALAIGNGKILAAGTEADLLKLQGPKTKIIDLNGAFVMPGFNDAHTHLAYGGTQKLTIDLNYTTSLADMQQRIKSHADTAKPGAWLTGWGWDHTTWPTRLLPDRTDIDAVTAGHPAIVFRTDGHIAVANSAALAAANITSATPDPFGAKIDRDASGNPTGILREDAALNLVLAKIPPQDPEDRRAALDIAITDALSHGVTSTQDFSTWQDFLILEDLERTGKLHLRISEWLPFLLPLDVLKQYRASHPAGDLLLHIGMLKGFMDGSLGSRTAALNAPYADDPGNSGIPRYDPVKLNQMAIERAEAGFQMGFHAIGDHANEMALDAFQQATEARRKSALKFKQKYEADHHVVLLPIPDDFRYRIEHAQVVSPAIIDRYADLHIIASMQPSHLLTDMNWATDRLGPERAKYAYAWKSFLNHHVTLAFGTDYPVESINPFRGLYSAITRQNEAGTKTFQPQEKLTLDEALFAYTQASAFAEYREHQKGRLEPGYLADFIVLDRDITKASPQQLLHTKVLRTIVNGDVVYTAEPVH
jgi:predicted amidohydrolase YtcJ